MIDLLLAGLTGLGGIIWGVRLEGRVNGHDTLFLERQRNQDERDDDIRNRLVRIEQKLDRSNGKNHAHTTD